MGAKQTKGQEPGGASPQHSWRRTPTKERGDMLTSLMLRSGDRLNRGGSPPPPYQRRIGMIQEMMLMAKQGKHDKATEMLKMLRQDLGMESTSLDDVLYRYASFRNLVDPITHDLIISLAKYVHCPKTVPTLVTLVPPLHAGPAVLGIHASFQAGFRRPRHPRLVPSWFPPSSASTPYLKPVPLSSAPKPRSLWIHSSTRPRVAPSPSSASAQRKHQVQSTEEIRPHPLRNLFTSGKINPFKVILAVSFLPGFSIWVCYVYDAMTEQTGQYPDPADPEDLRQTVIQHGLFLDLLYSTITRVTAIQEDLSRRLRIISQAQMNSIGQYPANSNTNIAAPTAGSLDISAASGIPENFRLQPEFFQGDVESCGGFLLQCRLIFQQAPRYYQADHSKITLIVNSLRGKALKWAQAFLTANPISQISFERFLGEFQLVFDQPRKTEEATRHLLGLRQRSRSVSEHLIDFRILAVEAGWPDVALKGVFYRSLNNQIKDHLCSQSEARTFEELVTAALRSDVRLRERQVERAHTERKTVNNPVSKTPMPESPSISREHVTCSSEEPMQIGHSKLTPEERRRRQVEEPLDHPVKAAGLGGQLLTRITHRTRPVQLVTSGNHHEVMQFYITQTLQSPVILGFPWLRSHNPQFDWVNLHITNWSTHCLANCLRSAVPSVSPNLEPAPDDIDLSKEGDSLGAMEKVCRQLTYHLSPHSQWRRHGLLKRKPQACLKAVLSAPLASGTLDLSGIPLTARDMERLCAHLQRHAATVVSLELGFTELTDEAFLLLLPTLAALPHLETLTLNGNRLTRAVLKDLTDALKDPNSFPSVTWIDLGNNVDIFSLPQPFLVSLRKRCPKQGNLPTILEFGESQASDPPERQRAFGEEEETDDTNRTESMGELRSEVEEELDGETEIEEMMEELLDFDREIQGKDEDEESMWTLGDQGRVVERKRRRQREEEEQMETQRRQPLRKAVMAEDEGDTQSRSSRLSCSSQSQHSSGAVEPMRVEEDNLTDQSYHLT
ncbi:uncharacterized protein lrrc75a isoform X7 [Oryzias latipes]